MRNSQRQKFSSSDPKKNVSILKCFLCNQLFYVQSTFDVHMKQHQSKINRNIPEQIQRKTMESFSTINKIYKNNKSNLLPLQGLSMQLNKTQTEFKQKNMNLTSIRGKGLKKTLINSPTQQKTQQLNVNLLLQQSTILMQKMTFLTQSPTKKQHVKQQSDSQPQSQQIQKHLSQKELQKQILYPSCQTNKKNMKLMEKKILETYMIDQQLKGYQQQLEHCREMSRLTKKSKNIEKIKDKIVTKIVERIQEENQLKIYKNNSKQVNNRGINYCSECYSQIDSSQQFYRHNCGHYYHKQCSQKNYKCCK